MKLIDKSVLVAEIEKRIKAWEVVVEKGWPNTANLMKSIYEEMLSIANTLEVKEVDYRPIDNDFERDAVNFCLDNGLNTTPRIAKTIAKHFFELGIKAQKGENV